VTRERMRASWWTAAAAVLCTVSAAGAQTTSLDRDVKATPGREGRVGIYTSIARRLRGRSVARDPPLRCDGASEGQRI
jgi:hypothetical protein